MKRSVFILVLSLAGFQSPGHLIPGHSYLTSISPCDVSCVFPKSISDLKLPIRGKFKFNDPYILSPLRSKHQKLPIASITTPVILLTEALDIKVASRSFPQSRRKTKRYSSFLSNSFNNDIKVPP